MCKVLNSNFAEVDKRLKRIESLINFPDDQVKEAVEKERKVSSVAYQKDLLQVRLNNLHLNHLRILYKALRETSQLTIKALVCDSRNPASSIFRELYIEDMDTDYVYSLQVKGLTEQVYSIIARTEEDAS